MINDNKIILITGGAGFIGTNLAKHFLEQGRTVRILDNLSREGVDKNLDWLVNNFKDKVQVVIGDVTNEKVVDKAITGASKVFHFAAQVAVTTSLIDPINDFEVNVRGTLNVLESIRNNGKIESLVYTSTNKVYGNLDDVMLTSNHTTRYNPVSNTLKKRGIDESRPLDFHSPYGCSKGSADQYILNYYRSYNIPSVVFRMSCIYGPHQFGTEDQGWVAHFVIRALQGKTITLYGDGKQVRDILFVEDLVNAFDLASSNISRTAGKVFNMGGGVNNTVSLIEILNKIKGITNKEINIIYEDWRVGDQKYYVSNTNKFNSLTNWAPQYNVDDGLTALINWQVENNPNIKIKEKEIHLSENKIKNKAVA